MRINVQNFFDHYIIDPMSKELAFPERVLALSLSILFALPTLGLLHLRAKYLQNKSIVNMTSLYVERQGALDRTAASISNVSIPLLLPHQQNVAINQSEVGSIIQNKLIEPFYAKPLPKEEQVTVPVQDPVTKKSTWRLWNTLSREEKVRVNNTGTRAHNQLPKWAPAALVDAKFFCEGQAPFIEGDPRKHHGNDHAARAAIFSTVFAYLYHKYAPEVSVSRQDLTLCQLVAAGHDSGRQTEGPDVYDDASADNVQAVLKSLGVTSSTILQDAHQAIADKDSSPFHSKALIAKCVQCADSAEYARLLLDKREQYSRQFSQGKEYLDIYKELSSLARHLNADNPDSVELKDGLTFANFTEELDAIRREMNDLIYHTHQQSFRSHVVHTKENVYNAILEMINPTEYPLLTSVLRQIGVKEKRPSAKQVKQQQTLSEVKSWLRYGIDQIPMTTLESFEKKLRKISLSDAKETHRVVETELQDRRQKVAAYEAAVGSAELIRCYEALPPIMRDYANFAERMPPELLMKRPEYLLEESKAFLKQLSSSKAVAKDEIDALQDMACRLLKHDVEGAQTTGALMLQLAARLYLQIDRIEEAKGALKHASDDIRLSSSNKFYDIKRLLADEKQGSAIVHTPADCGMLRKRKVGVIEKVMDGKELYELSFELPAHVRSQLDVTLEKLVPKEAVTKVPSIFTPKSGGEYVSGAKNITLGEDRKISLVPGVEILIGDTKKYYNQRHLMRVRITPGTPMQEVHRALSQLGLATALLPSRKEDINSEVMARSIAFRFPEIAYHDPYTRLPPEELYGMLSDSEKKIVDNDIAAAKLTQVGNGHYEMVIPHIAKEAWQAGVRSVGTFIWGGASMHNTAAVLKNILKNGLLSSQERFQHGILGNGCCPIYNYQSGSADQVFARILTKNFFYSNFPMENFAITGKVFVMMDPQVLERMPYAYVGDRNGVRNPDYYVSNFAAEKQAPIAEFKGHEMIRGRLGFKKHLEALNKEKMPINEVMLDLNCGAKYIKKLVVWTEEEKITLIAELQRVGIYEIGGRLLEDAVVAAKNLHPSLVDDYIQENPYSEEKLDGTAYI